ncbi:MAG TPA: aminotransferase class V-fold PLP-dependent enzyme [Thermomicrobiales bacterium]|nr:aminotransferase class V-fold PLP-dependent enzyme [Thermomicrobiales bacterium]
MDRAAFLEHFTSLNEGLDAWHRGSGPFDADGSVAVPAEKLTAVFSELSGRLRDNYPYGHPRYAGQMLKPPHPVAVLAYATAMQINPNNHALDSSMATSRMEREAVAALARMFGYDATHLGHLTGGGTIANLEALWVARSLHPDTAIAVSDQAHYTHARACELLGARLVSIPSDERGRIDLAALRDALKSGEIGTVVATTGTTGLGAVDPVHEIVPLARAAGARVHVDAAYGGFFSLLARRDNPPIDPAPFLAIAESDSVVVDPHKHGLQPYGCGSVLFRDPAIGRFYVHDSPYTYFTSDELHLGEISLECSRAGAAAAALWATLEALPLDPSDGFGAILAQARAAALDWAALIRDSAQLRLVVEPELDIINFYPVPRRPGSVCASQISALTDRVFRILMDDPNDPIFLAKLIVQRDQLAGRHPSIEWDTGSMTVLRSVLMKPEHRAWVPRLHRAVEAALATAEMEST